MKVLAVISGAVYCVALLFVLAAGAFTIGYQHGPDPRPTQVGPFLAAMLATLLAGFAAPVLSTWAPWAAARLYAVVAIVWIALALIFPFGIFAVMVFLGAIVVGVTAFLADRMDPRADAPSVPRPRTRSLGGRDQAADRSAVRAAPPRWLTAPDE